MQTWALALCAISGPWWGAELTGGLALLTCDSQSCPPSLGGWAEGQGGAPLHSWTVASEPLVERGHCSGGGHGLGKVLLLAIFKVSWGTWRAELPTPIPNLGPEDQLPSC